MSQQKAEEEIKECLLRAVHWCLTYATNNKAWDRLRQISPNSELPFPFYLSHWQLMRWLEMEAKLEITYYDRCVNGCLAYTDGYSLATACESCKEPRYRYVGP